MVPHGKVLFSRGEDEAAVVQAKGAGSGVPVEITDAERDAVTFTAYALDVHLVPARSEMTVRARMTVRNDGALPLKRIALQVSSGLLWESLAEVSGRGLEAGKLAQHRIDTDADHTGAATEAVVSFKTPLAVGASLDLVGIYGGKLAQSGERLQRIGAPAEAAEAADWDQVSAEEVALRGYGDVLWYPVAGAPVFLGEGVKLFQAAGRTKLRQQTARVRLRLEMEYVGEAPQTAYFCGRKQGLNAVSENQNVPVAESPGVATAEWSEETLGFRVPSLFVTERAAMPVAGGLVEAVSEREDAVEEYGQAARLASPMLQEWLGREPMRALTVLDHPGQPFEDKAFLVTPMRAADPTALAPTLVHTLSHAYFRSPQVWLDEGVAQFMSLLWVEKAQGRGAALSRMEEDDRALALIEPGAGSQGGESLVEASDEVYYRTKAAAVLWMLRDIVGDPAMKSALAEYRKSGNGDRGFQRLLEARANRSLAWFFDDWVYKDKGLPDLSIVTVNPHEMPEVNGRAAGWLVAVEVRNEGDAVAEVPVTVRAGSMSGDLIKTERLRVAGRSTASTRIVFEGTPEEVLVNDGTVPEVGGGEHRRKIVPGKPQ